MQQKMKNNFLTIIIIFLIGWGIGLLIQDLNWFQYDSQFNLFELLYFLGTGLIALYVAHKIEKSIQDNRTQKDMIINKIQEVDSSLIKLKESFVKAGNKYKITNFHLQSQAKNIAIQIKRYEMAIKSIYPNILKSTDYKKISTRKLVKICSLTPLTPNLSEDICCLNDEWQYSENKYVEISNEIENMRDLCFSLTLKLNMQ